MTAICKMTGKETELPCSARACPLFGDCIVEFQKGCRKSKPKQTNADCIWAMSDEKLAEECADDDLTSALLALLDTVPAHQKLYPELYVDKIVKLVNGGK